MIRWWHFAQERQIVLRDTDKHFCTKSMVRPAVQQYRIATAALPKFRVKRISRQRRCVQRTGTRRIYDPLLAYASCRFSSSNALVPSVRGYLQFMSQ